MSVTTNDIAQFVDVAKDAATALTSDENTSPTNKKIIKKNKDTSEILFYLTAILKKWRPKLVFSKRLR